PDPFSARLEAAVAEVGAPVCVGLDPDPARLPASVGDSQDLETVVRFCIAITESATPYAAAYKPNLAFFEAYGAGGWHALAQVCEAVRATGRLLVLDGKRGDIGNTGRKYATALYDRLGGDACTVAPYMGGDSVTPFLGHPGRCAFVLVATSNPGAADLQRLDASGRPLFLAAADLATEAARDLPSEAGFVVGATQPDLLADLRQRHPVIPFLVPGVGAQGGSAEAVLDANAGGPILVNASRSILYAASGPDFAEAAADAAQRLNASLR
ncbi:MAG: orotidine-5'-phosphate decarboxylase, partial [Bacteroidota bacterium]